MPLRFRNDTSLPLEIAVASYEGRCTGSHWRKEGWWQIPPRGQITIFNENVKNKIFFFYGRSTNHVYEWKGEWNTNLPDTVFSRCWDETGGIFYGMRRFMASSNDYTYPLYL
ncbi:DUF1036 domain-containing protein [Bacillus cereus]|uniref:DUF1036 domain-containing protein n=1 Tax=Bacillus cereus TaxID=1396 RepID=UPI0035C787B5